MRGDLILAFLLGLASGAGATYLYFRKDHVNKIAADLQANREHYAEKEKELIEKYKSEYAKDIADEIADSITETDAPSEPVNTKINYNALYNKEPLVTSEEKVEDKIYLISPEAYYSETFYDKKVLTYYEGDDVLCDELTDDILDIENTIGIENIESFGNPLEEPDADPFIMHVRNNKFGAVYEVIKDERSYSAVIERDDEK